MPGSWTIAAVGYRALAATRLPRATRRLRNGAATFCFHNIVPMAVVGAGERSLHLGTGDFEEIAGWMRSAYEVILLSELVERVESGRAIRGLAAITFDDAYAGVFEEAAPVLRALGLPATVFAVSEAPERQEFFWWDRLASKELLTVEVRDRCLGRHRGIADEVLDAFPGAADASALPDSLRPASWDQIRGALGSPFEIGSHTVRHPNLTALSADELRAELTSSRRTISERCGRDAQMICYPYGAYDDRVLAAAHEVGYRAGVTLVPRLVGPTSDLLALPRVNVPAGISVEALECWAAGWMLRRAG